METVRDTDVRALCWRDARLHLLDQRSLPAEERWLVLDTATRVAEAIHAMAVRGAPAIGIAAAFGVVLSAQTHAGQPATIRYQRIQADMAQLAAARPTAVNLTWALRRMQRVLDAAPAELTDALLAEAQKMLAEDLTQNLRMGELGAALISPGSAVLTHCNTGSLATGGHGTALGVIRSAWRAGRIARIFATETRPWLQGARLTVWELARDGIPVTLIADSAAAHLMAREGVAWLMVGADRIAANGDVANKIGTYGLALAAHAHGTRVMVVAPSSTVDMGTADGAGIPIENRGGEELLKTAGFAAPPAGVTTFNPVFDITPAKCVDALVTERGIVTAPDRKKMAEVFEKPRLSGTL